MLNLAAIERAIAAVESVSRSETTIEVGDLRVVIRPLSGQEEVDVLEYALGGGQVTKTEFYFRSQVRTLAYTIVQIGDVDLRERIVETNEEVDGVRVKKSKVDVVGAYIEQHWSKVVVMKLFVCAVNALEAATTKVVDKIRSNPFDYDAEIERLKARMKDLETTRDQIKSSNEHESWASSMRASAVQYAEAAQEDLPEEDPTPPAPEATGRRPSFPAAPVQERTEVSSPTTDPRTVSSFLDEGNPEASMATEIQRQLEIRRRGHAESLRQARNTQQVVAENKAPVMTPPKNGWGQGPQQDVFLSTDGPIEVSERTVENTPAAVPMNQPPPRQPHTNPRFRPR